MLVIICAKYEKNSSSTVEQTKKAYFNSFIAKLWLKDLEDIGQGQRRWQTFSSQLSFAPNRERIPPELYML